MAVLSLPLSFTNSFWTPDYRRGLEVLFSKLEQGLAENDEIIAFIRARAAAEGQLAMALINPAPTGHDAGTGFHADDGASLLMAFRGLQAESAAQGAAHRTLANELTTLVADPFADWAKGYRERIGAQRALVLDSWLGAYEAGKADVARLKKQYAEKTRKADEAEDDAKFAPNSTYDDKEKFTSPRQQPADVKPRPTPQRSATVSERIASRLKDLRLKSANALADVAGVPGNETVFEVTPSDGEKTPDPEAPAKVDKGKGRAVEEPDRTLMTSPPPMDALPPPTLRVSPAALPPIILANVAFQPADLSALLKQAKAELATRAIRIPLLGEYTECFSGEAFVAWLNERVSALGGDLDRAEDAARALCERENLLRHIGELGNSFVHADDAFYQFRPRAFELDAPRAPSAGSVPPSPAKALAPLAGSFMKRSGTLAGVVAKALQTNGSAPGEPAYVRARREAEEADQAYRVAVRRLDRQRLHAEEKVEETLKVLQKWETERLRAVKTVLLQYQGTLSGLGTALAKTDEASGTLIAAYQPDQDLKALIERYRTGPFHPVPQVYESPAHDESDVLFGIDLRKWAPHGAEMTGENAKETYPNVLTALLTGITTAYGRLPNDAEKRKAWIYEVPLTATHHLREALNGIDPAHPIPADVLEKYDAPVIAGTIKLWILELDPPLATWEGWEDFRKLYPTVGGKASGEISEQQHIQDLSATLQKLPRVHLYVLDAIASHLKKLIDSTTVDEDTEAYLTKLALSMGRMLFIDLVKNYEAILPPTITRKKRESERKVPVRKRTAMVDMRSTRAKISAGAPIREIAKQTVPPVPPMPQAAATTSPTQATPVVTSPVAASQPPAAPAKPATPPPPPPAAVTQVPTPPAVPPPPPVQAAAPQVPPPPPVNANQPPRPSFKEPPPEDDTPSRPAFKDAKDSSSEEDDDDEDESSEAESTPPRPSFKEPEEEAPLPMPNFPDSPPATPPPVEATRPIALKRNSLMSQNRPASPANASSRSPSPAEDAMAAARA
ncbi:hypothetical protein HWV62_1048, partial [Athelia sp. TMB]